MADQTDSNKKQTKKPVLLGFGESEDPMPEFSQESGFRVFAGACKDCGCAGRKLLPSGERLALVCDNCGSEFFTNLKTAQLDEVCYVYWCNKSKFESDNAVLSDSEAMMIEAEIKKLGSDFEIPHWAVMIVAGRCVQSDLCVNSSCPYRLLAL